MSVLHKLRALKRRGSSPPEADKSGQEDQADTRLGDAGPEAEPLDSIEKPRDSQASEAVSMWDLVAEPAENDREPPRADPAPDSPTAPATSVDKGPSVEVPPEPALPVETAPQAVTPAPPPPAPKPTARSGGGRVKTRLLGFEHANPQATDVFEKASQSVKTEEIMFPVGWMVVIGGPGRGASIPIQAGASQIGRGEDQAIQLDFGDTTISRENHAAIAFDPEENTFFIGHGGKSNLVRLNGKPLLSTERLKDGDEVKIGETTLRLVALCGESFSWDKKA